MSYRADVYKAVALIFLVTVIIASVFILHFTLARAVIIITTSERPISAQKEVFIAVTSAKKDDAPPPSLEELAEKLNTLQLSILDDKSGGGGKTAKKDDLDGRLFETKVSGEKIFQPSGAGQNIEGVASGLVRIVNDANYNQTLVKNTRLLTRSNALFRIDKTVLVPKKGSVEVTAHADQKGAAGDIAPASFTIPGLSKSAQKLIYAKSEKPFMGGLSKVGVVTNADITNAEIAVVEAIENKGLVEMNANDANISLMDIIPEIISLRASAEEGDTVAQFTVSGEILLRALSFDKNTLKEIMKKELASRLKADEMVLTYDDKSFQYEILKFDEGSGDAAVRASLQAFTTMKIDVADDLKALFAGETKEAVKDRLIKNPHISAVSIKLWPFWVKKVPRLKDHIDIVVIENGKAPVDGGSLP